jgi:hypothetical protein
MSRVEEIERAIQDLNLDEFAQIPSMFARWSRSAGTHSWIGTRAAVNSTSSSPKRGKTANKGA